MTWSTGLCSVTYRQLEPDRIIALAAEAGISAIEWGSDVHAPPGDTATAVKIARQCSDTAIQCPTLGSYARATNSARSQSFDALLDTAEALGAKTIRVWAGETGFAQTSAIERAAIADKIQDYVALADARGMNVALEYHPNTLTDCREGALWLLREVSHPALRSYWQPVPDQPVSDCRGDLAALAGRLAHIHVFYWNTDFSRNPLADGVSYWTRILTEISVPSGGHAFLEFVQNDDPGILKREAASLSTLLTNVAHTLQTM